MAFRSRAPQLKLSVIAAASSAICFTDARERASPALSKPAASPSQGAAVPPPPGVAGVGPVGPVSYLCSVQAAKVRTPCPLWRALRPEE